MAEYRRGAWRTSANCTTSPSCYSSSSSVHGRCSRWPSWQKWCTGRRPGDGVVIDACGEAAGADEGLTVHGGAAGDAHHQGDGRPVNIAVHQADATGPAAAGIYRDIADAWVTPVPETGYARALRVVPTAAATPFALAAEVLALL